MKKICKSKLILNNYQNLQIIYKNIMVNAL
jgi:hypothetical protein